MEESSRLYIKEIRGGQGGRTSWALNLLIRLDLR
jgi:hypothetical protein